MWELADPLQCQLLNFQECWKYHVAVVVVVQSLGCVQLFVTPWTSAHQTSQSFTISQSLLKFMSIELVMPSSHLILRHPFFLLSSIFASIRVFSNESALLIRWPKYWSFTFSISPYYEYLVFIFFRIDWFDLLAIQATLKSLLQAPQFKNTHSCGPFFFMVQLSLLYMSTGKTIAWTNRPLSAKWCFCLICCLDLS